MTTPTGIDHDAPVITRHAPLDTVTATTRWRA